MKPPIRVLLYSHVFAPAIGGVETFVMQLARGLSRLAADSRAETFEVTVVTQTPRGEYADQALPFRVVRQPSLWQLLRLVRGSDVVQLAGPCFWPLLLCLMLHKPVVIEQHGYQAICPNGLLFYQPTQEGCPGHFMADRYWECLRCNALTDGWRRSLAMLLSTFPRLWMCRRATLNACISSHVQKRLGLARSRVIYYGIEDPLAGGQVKGDFAALEPVCVAYVGRLVAEKGLPLLLRAAWLLKQEGFALRVKMVGDGPERNRLERLATELGVQGEMSFTGFLRGQELEAALSDVAAVIMPSVWEETAGLAVIEHMMRGRVAVVSDIGGLGEVVGDVAVKFAPNDAGALAECLKLIIERRAIVRELGDGARKRALELFQRERMVQEYARTYKNP